MNAIRFTVPGDPIPWERSRSRGGQHFTAPRTREHQDRIRFHAKRHFRAPLSGPLSLVVVAHRASARRCDVDNIAKTVQDALNRLAYADDSQIVLLTCHKLVDREHPRTEVEIRRMPDTGLPVNGWDAHEQAEAAPLPAGKDTEAGGA